MLNILLLMALVQIDSESQFDVQANTFTNNRQTESSIATDSNGNVLAVWGSRRQELGTFGIFAQFFDPLGRPLSTEIHVNQYYPREQSQPSVYFDKNDTAWIFWRSVGQDGSGAEVYGRRYIVRNRTLSAQSDEFRVNQAIAGDQRDGVCCSLPNGNILATWVSEKNGVSALFGRIFSSEGVAISGDIELQADKDKQLGQISLAAHPEGVLAAWSRSNLSGSPDGIAGALFNFDDQLNKLERLFVAHNGEESLAIEPCIDSANDGSFVISWMDTIDGSAFSPTAKRFNSELIAQGNSFVAPTNSLGHHSGAQVAVADNGEFIVAYTTHHPKAWRGPGRRPDRPSSIYGQKYNADGSPNGALTRLNQFDEGEQNLQIAHNGKHLLWSSQNQIIAAWHGNTGTDHRAAGLSFWVPSQLNPPAPAPIEPLAAAKNLQLNDVYGDEAKPVYDPFFIAPAPTPPPLALGGIGGFQAFTSTGWTPPDPDLAVGPNHIVAVVNGGVRIFDKTGNQSYSASLVGFWSSVGAGGFVFDPVALYDHHTDRYVIAAADGAGNSDAICLAVSDDNDPNGTWHKYRFPVSSTCNFLDFPNLGVSDGSLYMAGDCFNGGGNRVFMWDMNSLINGSPATMKQVQANSSVQSLGATKNYDANNNVGYFATTYAGNSSQIMLRAVTNANTSPVLHSKYLTVPSYSWPPDAAQMGTSNLASTIDYRIKNGVVRDGKMWICHNTGNNNACQIRWYEIDLRGWPTSGSSPSLLQSGTLNYGNGEHTWFGDITVSANGNAAISFSRSSTSQFISVEYALRSANDPNGTFRPPVLLQASTAAETGDRWGDYSGIEEDPSNPGKYWSHNEFRASSWRTWVGEFEFENDLDLSISPIHPGGLSAFNCASASPGENVHFLVSLTQGSYVPPQLGGLAVELAMPIYHVGSGVANNSGDVGINVNIPNNAPLGADVYVQAVAIRGVGGADSVKSNLVMEVIN
ncbi:MAG: hypothetical protein QGF46_03370 [Planctomycetota bacterium]|jgi:hypothetical protein|nr:hypothetical protein [Planctomycetota bacterium]